jgi:hypothetical protein
MLYSFLTSGGGSVCGAWLASMVGLALLGVGSCIIAAAGAQTELMVGRTLQGLASGARPHTDQQFV